MPKQRKLITVNDPDKINFSEICPANSKMTLISKVPVFSFFSLFTGNLKPRYWNLVFEIELLSTRPVPVIQTIELIDHQKTGQLVRRYRKQRYLTVKQLAEYTVEKYGFSEVYLELLERGDRPWTEKTFELILDSIDTLYNQMIPIEEVENVNSI